MSALSRIGAPARVGASARVRSIASVALAATVTACAFAAGAAFAGTPATTANDVCASNADPCNVTSVFDVQPNAVLDFGTRSVNVTGAGRFDFSSNSGRIASGNFTATTTGAFLNAAGPGSFGTRSGSVLLQARRRCSSATPPVPCLGLSDCELGPCGVRRCSLKSTRTCQADADCQIGVCSSLKRCSGSTALVRCNTNADCDYGTCPAQLTCTGRGDNPLNCSSNSDCSYGTCSVGAASITIDGTIAGSSDSPATIVLRAADSVSISKTLNLNSTSIDSDGGDLAVEAETGSITVTGKINANGGGTGQGGTIELIAGTDISIHEDIDVIGGDFDGGAIEADAGRDVSITRSLLASSNAGAGFGGEIIIAAGRDFTFTGVSAANKSTMEVNGHTDISNTAGDGGAIDLTAARDLSFDANTRLIGNGSVPDGSGADVLVEAGGALALSGNLTAKSGGVQGYGGFVEVMSGGTANVGATATFDVTGGASGGGYLEIDSNLGDVIFAGDADVSAGGGGGGGVATLSAKQQVSVTGSLFVAGPGGSLGVEACRVTLASGASLDNNGGGSNRLVTHDIMSLLAGSSLTADSGGVNTLRYRNSGSPPLVQGTVSPSPQLIHDPTLTDCPLCGNGALDAGESCDDGNGVNGDGCSAECQNERCLSQTIAPGYPTVALCEDGDVCTDDVCNTGLAGGTCEHPPKNCDDSVSCTVDVCDASDGTCRHSASDSMCNDGNACTDDFCSATMGCSNAANNGPCDDGNRCTETDTCSDKVCRGTRISGCLFCGDDFINVFSGEQCDDGNDVSGDCCSSTCRFEAVNSPCEDLQFCTVDDKCDGAATCLSGPPNTCVDTDACTEDSCSEEMAVCVHAELPREASSCFVAPGSKLQIKNVANAKRDKLQWQWNRGDGFSETAVGTPDAATNYTLCVYDRASTVSSLKASIDIAPSATRWNTEDPAFVQYKDKAGASDGVLKAQIKGGDAGDTKVKIKAGGVNLALPAPSGGAYFRQEPSVVVQLVNSAGMCWTSEFAPENTKLNGVAAFQATTK